MTGFGNEVHKVEGEVSGFAREIVLKRVAIVAVITILLNLAVSYGWLSDSAEALGWLNTALDAVGGLVAVLAIRPAVTPVKSPKNDAGESLVPTSVISKAITDALDKKDAESAAVAKAAPQPDLGNAEVGLSADTTPSA